MAWSSGSNRTPLRDPRTADGRTHVASSFDRNIFVNCPFDDAYLPLLRPLLFTLIFLGFRPRIASERSDSAENRIDKICELVRESRYSIHDLSRMRAGAIGEFSRMNMPFELGIEYGCRQFGKAPFDRKRCLVLEREQHEFRKALSDLSGIDIKSHGEEPERVVRCVRDWLVETAGLRSAPSATNLWYLFNEFARSFHAARTRDGFSDKDLLSMPIPEYIYFIRGWVRQRA